MRTLPDTSISKTKPTNNKLRDADIEESTNLPTDPNTSRDLIEPQDLDTYQLWRSKVGRKKKITPEVTRNILRYLREGNTVKDTCSLVGISQDTFYKEVKLNPEFDEWVEDALVSFKEKHIKRINKASEADPKFSQWMLSVKFPNEYAQKSMIATTMKGEVKIIVDAGGYNPSNTSYSDNK